MLKKILLSMPLLSILVNAQTLTSVTNEIIGTNPEIQEKKHYYNSVKEEYKFATSAYLPTIDFTLNFGREHTNSPSTRNISGTENGLQGLGLYKSESSLQLVQNIFRGFETQNEIDEQKARFLSASFSILEKTNSIALNVADSYIKVLKYKEIIKLEKQNIQTHKKILTQIKEKVDAGFSPRSDMLQVQTRYTLVKSNLLTQKNNLDTELIKFHKFLGRFMDRKEFIKPKNSFKIPTNIDKATKEALDVHPAIKVANFNVEARKFAYKKQKKGYYPNVNFILKAEKNSNTSAIEGETDRYYAGIELKYNLFKGFADEASVQKNISVVNEENSLRNIIRRQVIESVRLAWSNYDSFVKKEKVLQKHVEFADQAREAYLQEFLIGKRTLLDILNIEGEYNNAQKSKTENEYTMLYTQYQLMDSMGILSDSLGITDSKYTKSIDAQGEKDSLPLDLESDKDNVIDMQDICDKTVDISDLTIYGCKKVEKVEEEIIIEEEIQEIEDIIEPQKIEEEISLKIEPIAELESFEEEIVQETKVKRNLEKEMIYFEYKSSLITENSIHILDRVIDIMKNDENLKLKLFAYTDSLASKKYNKKLSLSRALIVKNHLMEEGIASSRISVYGMGEESPIASNSTKDGRAKNRRVEFTFVENKKAKRKRISNASDIELAPLDFNPDELEEVEKKAEYDSEDVELEQIEIDF